MRCSAIAALGLSLAAALVLSSAGCTPVMCSRNSDCPGGQVCSASAGCMIAPDGGSDGADGDGAAPTAGSDAGTGDAATTDAAAGLASAPLSYPLRCDHGGTGPPSRCHEGGRWPP